MKQLQRVTSSIFWETLKGKGIIGTILVWMMSLMLVTFSAPAFSAIVNPPVVQIVSPSAGANVVVGQQVSLIANASSGIGIATTEWSIVFRPIGGTSVITQTSPSGSQTSFAVFTPNVAGSYVIEFLARDLIGQDRFTTIQLNAQPALPVANAGPDIPIALNGVVNLDGSGSTGTITGYSWVFLTKPAGSTAALSNSSIVNPTFVADVAGTYTLKLTVANSAGSASDEVAVSTINSKPVADAGVDLSGLVGSATQLNGSQSYDPDGDAITYHWILATVPAGSTATLSNPTVVNPSLILDKPGTYIAQLIVNDGQVTSDPDTVAINTSNTPPVANAGSSKSVPVGTLVNLNGNASFDADGGALTYAWSFTSKPAGSLAVLANAAAVITTFTPDVAGSYVIQLVVNDGLVNSAPSTVSVMATISQTTVINQIQNLQTTISGINSDVLKNKNMQKTLNNKLNSVIQSVEAHDYADALSQLQGDILGKVDGCAANNAPDKNDWILDCNVQSVIYAQVQAIIASIQGLTP